MTQPDAAAALLREGECFNCKHLKVHHDEQRCWVYVRRKRPPHECPCIRWAGRPALDVDSGTTTDCPMEGVHEHAFRGPHRFHEWDPAEYARLSAEEAQP